MHLQRLLLLKDQTHERVMTQDVSLYALCYWRKISEFLLPDPVKSLKKSNGVPKKQLEETKRNLKKLEQRVSEQEHSVRNVNDSSASSAILNREAEASLKFSGHGYDVPMVQLEK